jgi:hypothetical protein
MFRGVLCPTRHQRNSFKASFRAELPEGVLARSIAVADAMRIADIVLHGEF